MATFRARLPASHPVIAASSDYHHHKAQSVCTGKHWLLCRELGKITSSSAAAGTTMEKRSRHFIARESAVAKAVVNVAKAHYAQAERERACCLDDSKTRDTS